MKKILLLTVIALAISTSAYAVATISVTTSIGSLTFNPSNRVHVSVASGVPGYVAQSLHASGSRVFVTDQVESKIYWKDATIGTTPTAAFTSPVAPADALSHGTPNPTSGYTPL